jgi:hypothetical protein
MHLNTFITYIKYSYMFRPLLAILREWYTIKHQPNDNNNMRSESSGPGKSYVIKMKSMMRSWPLWLLLALRLLEVSQTQRTRNASNNHKGQLLNIDFILITF